jgi:hypothetical protein
VGGEEKGSRIESRKEVLMDEGVEAQVRGDGIGVREASQQ